MKDEGWIGGSPGAEVLGERGSRPEAGPAGPEATAAGGVTRAGCPGTCELE
jgi:hypothetical protein